MALQDLLALQGPQKKIGISTERVEKIKPMLRQYIAFWREYPDLFVDFMARGDYPEERTKTFHLYFYQRILLRICMRYKYVYGVFPRA